jgi:putative DNA methylase
MVDDPGEYLPEAEATKERERLFDIMRRLVQWENTLDSAVFEDARSAIMRSTGGNMPVVVDPFAGGGSIPTEAARMGCDTVASDLNPVAVLINTVLEQLAPRFGRRRPVSRSAPSGAPNGLSADVLAYGKWMESEAARRLEGLYRRVAVPGVAGTASVVAWLWARTAKCPNPACAVEVPLVKSFLLSQKPADKKQWIVPEYDETGALHFRIAVGTGPITPATKVGRGAHFRCPKCDQGVPDTYIKATGKARGFRTRLMALIVESGGRRLFVSPTEDDEATALAAPEPKWRPDVPLAHDPRNLWCREYGIETFADLFTPRQLLAVCTFSELVEEARQECMRDSLAAGDSGPDAEDYARAVSTCLAFAVSKLADYSTNLCGYIPTYGKFGSTFRKQALPMMWDFSELNILGSAVGNWNNHIQWVSDAIAFAPGDRGQRATVSQTDAVEIAPAGARGPLLLCTDPPYYSNISYSDLSDFFYVWLRHSLQAAYPSMFRTLVTPKTAELVAAPHRHDGNMDVAKVHFRDGLARVFAATRQFTDSQFPATVFYAFRETDAEDLDADEGQASSGWETMLDSLIAAGYAVVGTWPMRTERSVRSIGLGTNALASSVVLVCRSRPANATRVTKREFIQTLRQELPSALVGLQQSAIAPVDLAQAAIGPGMAIFSQYAEVILEDGAPMSVRTALQLINSALDEFLGSNEGDYDADTRWAITWFEQRGYDEGPFGDAETLAKARNVAVSDIAQAGIIRSAAGKVRILRREDLRPIDYDPVKDERPTVWEYTQHLIRNLEHDGEQSAADLLKKLGSHADAARALAYRLYNACEKRKWADEARAYNGLVVAWPELEKMAAGARSTKKQATLDLGEGN